jgi:hypothetical protein
MARYIAILFLLLSFFCNPLIALQWWNEKPYTQWSIKQILAMLDDSPWVGLSPAGARREELVYDGRLYPLHPQSDPYHSAGWIPIFYRVRLLTAKPIREAYLRRIALDLNTSVNVKDLSISEAERQQSRFENFIDSNPDSFIIKGEDEFIILSLTLTAGIYPSRGEDFYGEELSPTNLSALIKNTKLETDTGKRLPMSDYVAPGQDLLGMKILFKRKLPDGTYFIAEGDKQLRFETHLNNKKVKVGFDLTKMIYKGNLEY